MAASFIVLHTFASLWMTERNKRTEKKAERGLNKKIRGSCSYLDVCPQRVRGMVGKGYSAYRLQ